MNIVKSQIKTTLMYMDKKLYLKTGAFACLDQAASSAVMYDMELKMMQVKNYKNIWSLLNIAKLINNTTT